MDCLPLESLQGSDVVFAQVELPFVIFSPRKKKNKVVEF